MKNQSNVCSFPSTDRFTGLTVAELGEQEQESLIELAIAVLAERHRPGEELTSPEDTKRYLRLRLSSRQTEIFGAVFLDNRHRIIADEELFQGTVDGASIHSRVVVQRALAVNAAAVILYHNHPSGIPEPSQADQAITKRLKDALSLVDTRVLDHLVVGAEGVVSFAERGLI